MRRFRSLLLHLGALACGFAASQAVASRPEDMAVRQDGNKTA
jgi:hypothetical protein